MEYRRFNDTYVVRLDRGEELVSCLKELCEKEEISLATIEGLGAADRAVIGLYDVEKKEFLRHEYERPFEITSIIGNVTGKDGEPYLHIHINLADEMMNVIGGHLNECRISATTELFVRVLDGEVGRMTDEKTGLNLFRFHRS